MSATSANPWPRFTSEPTANPDRSQTCQYWVITTPELVYPSLEGRASLLEGRSGTSILGYTRGPAPAAVETSALVGP